MESCMSHLNTGVIPQKGGGGGRARKFFIFEHLTSSFGYCLFPYFGAALLCMSYLYFVLNLLLFFILKRSHGPKSHK